MGILKTPTFGAMISPSNTIAKGSFDGTNVSCDESPPLQVSESQHSEYQDLENQTAEHVRAVVANNTNSHDSQDGADIETPIRSKVKMNACANENRNIQFDDEAAAATGTTTTATPKVRRSRVQFAEPEPPDTKETDGGNNNARQKSQKMDGRQWRKMQQIKRSVERRRNKFYSRPLSKRIAMLSKALLACVPYYIDDVTRQEDPTAVRSLKSIMMVQLGFAILLLGLAILDASSRGGDIVLEPLVFTLTPAIIGAVYLLARKWTDVPPSKVTRGLVFTSHLVLVTNYVYAFVTARLCPDRDPFGYGSGCGPTPREFSMEDVILYGATAACWLLLSCPAYVCISRVRAMILGRANRRTRMEKAGDAAKRQMRRFSV